MRTRNDRSRRVLESASSPLPLLKMVSGSFGHLSTFPLYPSYLISRLLILGSESGGKSLALILSVCRKKSCNPS